jgi:hypothetical protein
MGMTWIAACSGKRGIYQETIMTDEERQKLCAKLRDLGDDPFSFEAEMSMEQAANEIERLAKELANANRLLEINRRRSLEKSGGLEIKQSDAEPSLSDQMYGFHGAGFNSTTPEPQSDAEPVKVVHDDAFGWGILFNDKPVKCLITKREDAIDWLHTILAQSDAEPVKWQWRGKRQSGEWSDWADGVDGDFWDRQPSESYGRRNLYAAPPQPDASAGLSLIKGDRGGISWGGSFYVEGNRESIEAVRAAYNAQERCKCLDKMIGEKQLVRPDAICGADRGGDLAKRVQELEAQIESEKETSQYYGD